MTRPAWLRDSITRRFAWSIAASAATCLFLNVLVDILIGGPAFGPPAGAALLDRIPAIVQALDAAGADRRDALARAWGRPISRLTGFRRRWQERRRSGWRCCPNLGRGRRSWLVCMTVLR
jgi:hypothetical protein